MLILWPFVGEVSVITANDVASTIVVIEHVIIVYVSVIVAGVGIYIFVVVVPLYGRLRLDAYGFVRSFQ